MAGVHDLTMRQLQYVVAVADTLGFHRGAERCHVSQPTLSAQVAQLESALGVRIFERDRKRVLITPAGEELVLRARRVLIEAEDLVVAATRVRDPLVGTLRVGVIPTVAPYLLPEVMPKLTKSFPKLRLEFREEKTSDVVRELNFGRLDAGLLALVPEVSDLAHEEVLVDTFVVALPKGHPLARKKRISLSELENVDVLLLDEGHCFREQALALCARAGARETAFRATSLGTLAQMVSAGQGITLLPTLAVPAENRRGQLEIRPLVAPAPSRTIAIVWRHRSPLAGALQEIAATVRRAARA